MTSSITEWSSAGRSVGDEREGRSERVERSRCVSFRVVRAVVRFCVLEKIVRKWMMDIG
jgi:hypothetical protein